MDIRIWAVVISASVALIIAIGNHFIIEPIKAKRQWKRQQLTNFYAPSYGLTLAKINIVKDFCLSKKRISLGTADTLKVLSKDYFAEFIIKNSGYASPEFLNAWKDFIGKFPSPTEKETREVVSVLVKDYNRLRKELGYTYNQKELDTGIPEILKELREEAP
ncbi:hypothetical protein MM300_01605 [Evansella sp. LMS18]|uniref:hypothetical protein n=1 Tax=Evansella sp. LMS18 TaxID=2924033 RepID=UPI0020D0D8C4|nr:hypothetical protein [Evansella sp. LMS18]UTR11056.1 hypothetical protein MM300_01605 [Evansella sp. LMS18]